MGEFSLGKSIKKNTERDNGKIFFLKGFPNRFTIKPHFYF